jgi:hypothetical protein
MNSYWLNAQYLSVVGPHPSTEGAEVQHKTNIQYYDKVLEGNYINSRNNPTSDRSLKRIEMIITELSGSFQDYSSNLITHNCRHLKGKLDSGSRVSRLNLV